MIRPLNSGCGFAARSTLLAIVVALAHSGCWWFGGRSVGDDPIALKNLLLIVVDTLRADHVGSYADGSMTPSIDALAASGVQFERAYSHIPVTGPSHATMFTGFLPPIHGVTQNTLVLDDSFLTIAEVLRSAGLRTGAVVSLGVMQARFGLSQGFEHYDDHFDRQWFRPATEVTDAALGFIEQWRDDERFFAFVHYSDPHSPYAPPGLQYPQIQVEVDDEWIGDVSCDGLGNSFEIRWTPGSHEIRISGDGPRIGHKMEFQQLRIKNRAVDLTLGEGWAAAPGSKLARANRTTRLPATLVAEVQGDRTIDADFRFFVSEHLDPAEIRDRYALEVSYVDREIGRLLDSLEASGHLEDTLVVLTSDHGEGLGDHNLNGHIHQLYETLIRIPLIMSARGVLPEGRVEQGSAGLFDIRPTVLALLDVRDPVPGSGIDLLRPPAAEAAAQVDRPILGMTFQPLARAELRSIVVGWHKLIRDVGTDTSEVYNLEVDPEESDNLLMAEAKTNDLVAEMLARQLDDALARMGEQNVSAARGVDLDEEDVEQLRALGYLR